MIHYYYAKTKKTNKKKLSEIAKGKSGKATTEQQTERNYHHRENRQVRFERALIHMFFLKRSKNTLQSNLSIEDTCSSLKKCPLYRVLDFWVKKDNRN